MRSLHLLLAVAVMLTGNVEAQISCVIVGNTCRDKSSGISYVRKGGYYVHPRTGEPVMEVPGFVPEDMRSPEHIRADERRTLERKRQAQREEQAAIQAFEEAEARRLREEREDKRHKELIRAIEQPTVIVVPTR